MNDWMFKDIQSFFEPAQNSIDVAYNSSFQTTVWTTDQFDRHETDVIRQKT